MSRKDGWTVDELRRELVKYPGDHLVVLSVDSEGNWFDTLHRVEGMDYQDHEVHYRELTDEMRARGYTEEDVRADGQAAVVLWP